MSKRWIVWASLALLMLGVWWRDVILVVLGMGNMILWTVIERLPKP